MSESATNKKILIMAGGTGGHIFPALAIVNELKKHQTTIGWQRVLEKVNSCLYLLQKYC